MQNFTSNDLLLFLYNETPSETSLVIEDELRHEGLLREQYFSFQETINDIENFTISPDDRIIENIMSKFHHEKDAQVV